MAPALLGEQVKNSFLVYCFLYSFACSIIERLQIQHLGPAPRQVRIKTQIVLVTVKGNGTNQKHPINLIPPSYTITPEALSRAEEVLTPYAIMMMIPQRGALLVPKLIVSGVSSIPHRKPCH